MCNCALTKHRKVHVGAVTTSPSINAVTTTSERHERAPSHRDRYRRSSLVSRSVCSASADSPPSYIAELNIDNPLIAGIPMAGTSRGANVTSENHFITLEMVDEDDLCTSVLIPIVQVEIPVSSVDSSQIPGPSNTPQSFSELFAEAATDSSSKRDKKRTGERKGDISKHNIKSYKDVVKTDKENPKSSLDEVELNGDRKHTSKDKADTSSEEKSDKHKAKVIKGKLKAEKKKGKTGQKANRCRKSSSRAVVHPLDDKTSNSPKNLTSPHYFMAEDASSIERVCVSPIGTSKTSGDTCVLSAFAADNNIITQTMGTDSENLSTAGLLHKVRCEVEYDGLHFQLTPIETEISTAATKYHEDVNDEDQEQESISWEDYSERPFDNSQEQSRHILVAENSKQIVSTGGDSQQQKNVIRQNSKSNVENLPDM